MLGFDAISSLPISAIPYYDGSIFPWTTYTVIPVCQGYAVVAF